MKVENVAITDILPACFEIENSRLVAVSVDAMYNGEYHSYSGSGKVTVR